MRATAWTLVASPGALDELVALIAPRWSMVFWPDRYGVFEGAPPPSLERSLNGHVFSTEGELRWRRDLQGIHAVVLAPADLAVPGGALSTLDLELGPSGVQLLAGTYDVSSDSFRHRQYSGPMAYEIDTHGFNQGDRLVASTRTLRVDGLPAFEQYLEIERSRGGQTA